MDSVLIHRAGLFVSVNRDLLMLINAIRDASVLQVSVFYSLFNDGTSARTICGVLFYEGMLFCCLVKKRTIEHFLLSNEFITQIQIRTYYVFRLFIYSQESFMFFLFSLPRFYN
jgi:hypothetical protein